MWFHTNPVLTPEQIEKVIDDHVFFWHTNNIGVTMYDK